ncbi:diguanylate cyclase [Aliidiomarina quisquiliarum]|uniref:ligand-binding sensor domain-containing diguanylate cyclase n=1 Tax=Aliidiomarina quisquiliarum TaxID=2938947 RepID=UPI00208FD114|nr:diguanylate cyclase [Aliidiomarina quisquiliarum]MCO4321205.1 diguanylate cyclase [Aliidiomarina quisquiliarum]
MLPKVVQYGRRIAAAFIIGMLSLPVAAQELTFERFTDELGGQQSSVYGIYKDQHGFLWFSSDTDGLLRYDGYEVIRWFNQAEDALGHVSHGAALISQADELWAATWGNGVFRWQPKAATGNSPQLKIHTDNVTSSSNANTLLDNRVQVLFEDSAGRVFIGTLGGLNYVDAAANNTILSLPADNPLSRVRIWGIAETSNSLWFATTEGLIQLSLDLTEWQQHLPNPHDTGTNRLNEIRTVLTINDDVWIGFDEGVLLWDENLRSFSEVTYPAASNLDRSPRVNVLMQGANGSVFVGAEDGLYHFDSQTLIYKPTKNGLYRFMDGYDIRSLAIDNNASIWLGTRERGLFHSRTKVASFGTLIDTAPASLHVLLNRSISATHTAADNSLWLGGANGVLRRDGLSGEWQHWQFPLHTTARSVASILTDSYGNTWVAANNHLFHITKSAPDILQEASFVTDILQLQNASVTDIYEHSPGRVWFSIWGLGIVEYNLTTGTTKWVFQSSDKKHNQFVYDVLRIPNAGTWIVTRYSGLFYQAEGGNAWVNYSELETEPLPSRNLLCGFRSNNQLWICSEQGLIALDLENLQTKIFTKADGLPSNRIAGITEDDGMLWVTTSRGLALFEPQTNKIINFGINDGLPALAFAREAITRAPNGNIVAGTVKGAIEFNPKALAFSSNPPRVGLSKILIDNEDITRELSFNQPYLELSRWHSSIVVQYAVLDLHDPSRNTGRYRLLGLTDSWSAWSDMRQLTFSGLAPGVYGLEIEGRNSLGIRSQAPMRIDILVVQPWWYATWMWVLLAVALVLLVVLLINIRIRALQSANERLDALIKERTHELEELNKELREQSQTDYLTKLPNRRGFTERFHWLAAQLKRHQHEFSLVLLDVDYFKRFNDTYGHEAGDIVLVALSQLLQKQLRQQDIAARWGGEEFAILLPNAGIKSAVQVCEKISAALDRETIHYQGVNLKITVTFGIYHSTDTTAEALTIEHWIERADRALYRGKEIGRNQVVVYTAGL